jgi:hypothetical protein
LLQVAAVVVASLQVAAEQVDLSILLLNQLAQIRILLSVAAEQVLQLQVIHRALKVETQLSDHSLLQQVVVTAVELT